jgi:hypothetical protein
MKQPVKETQAFLDADDIVIRDEDDLISFKVSCESGLCKSAMRKLEATYLGEHNLVGKWVSAGFGVKLASGAYEYLTYGSFLVSEQTITKDTGTTAIVAYDKMIEAMKPYEKLGVNYPIDLYTYTRELCQACGLTLGNDSLPVHNDWIIEQELWENIEGITYRDIFVQIAQATATTCIIGNDDRVYFKPLTATGEQLTYDNMFKLKLEPLYGEINRVVLSRTPIDGEDVMLQDDESVTAYGLTEFKIDNNEIVDKARETAVPPIFEALYGVSYYPFETTTEGLGWYEIGDCFDIVNDTGDVFPSALFNFSITIDGGVKETLKTVAETKTQTQYQYATAIMKRVKNAELLVNKQDQYIQGIVSDMYDEDGVVNQKYTQFRQDIDDIVASVQNSGGNNLLKNSVMFAYDNDNKPYDWTLHNDRLTIQSDTESLANGGVSGHSFTLAKNEVSQSVSVNVSTDESPACYTFSIRIKKGTLGSVGITLYNDSEEHGIYLEEGDTSFYGEYVIKDIHPKENYFIVSISATGGEATFTDCMLSAGEYKSQWTQANGEVMNTQVNVSVDGVLVRSSVYQGDYTVMSPLEFAGYSNIDGTPTRVFSLNKDVTKVKKLEAEDEITMAPIKVVPITEGNLQGWAFVPTT